MILKRKSLKAGSTCSVEDNLTEEEVPAVHTGGVLHVTCL